MTPMELRAGLQFTVDSNNHVTAVVVNPDLWRSILHALEESEERELAEMLRERAPARVDISPLLPRDSNEDWS